MSTFKIAVIEGDGIGHEVIPEGLRVLEAAGKKFGLSYQMTHFDWSCEVYAKTGRMMPEDGLEQLKKFDAVFLGAVGYPGVADHVSLWGLLIPIRRGFDQYVNLRPVRLFKGVSTPLANRTPKEIDFVVIRENTEGEYSSIGGRIFSGTENEFAIQETVFTRRGVDRVMRYAFDLAQKRRKHVTSATKSNGIIHTMPFWDERFNALKKDYPDVKTDQFHIDILTAHFVRNPDWFDVVVGSNLFGDILSDLGPRGRGRHRYRAVGQSESRAEVSVDVRAGSRIGARHRGTQHRQPDWHHLVGGADARSFRLPQAARAVEGAIEAVCDSGPKTPDFGGKASTQEMGKAIAAAV
jgi:tartrate dehydrogenase/decarboxylase/D-malate dehydrogenase